MTKLNKAGNTSSFAGPDDDEDSDRKLPDKGNLHYDENASNKKWDSTRSDQICENKFSFYKDKDTSSKKSVVCRGKESSKMNIDSIIEEESRQRALNERSSILPNVQMIEIPTKTTNRAYMSGVLSAVRDTESKLDWKHLSEGSRSSVCSDKSGTETTVDQMGFVINQKAIAKKPNDFHKSYEEVAFKSR